MNELIVAGQAGSKMSSVEIADLMDKQHKHVMRDIKSLIEQGAIAGSSFGPSEYKDASGKTNPMYLLDFEATMTLITGYDAKRRSVVIKRWHDLEKKEAAQPAFQLPDFTNPAIAARAWADEVEQKIELGKQLQIQAPHVAALKRITMTDGEFNITTAAKILNLRPSVLFTYLEQGKYIYRRLGGKEWVAYQGKVQQGLFLHRTLTVTTPDGREKVIERCLVTPKGLAHLAEVYADKPQQHISGSKNVSKRQTSIQ